MNKYLFAAAVPPVFAAAVFAAPAADFSRDGSAARALSSVEREIVFSEAKRAQLEAEVQRLAADERALGRALAQAAAKARSLGKSLNLSAAKLAESERQQEAQRRILEARRAEAAEIFAALERLSYNPPPAAPLLPAEAEKALRASILLSALLPQMEAKTAQLQAETNRLAALTERIKAEQAGLRRAERQYKEEELKLNLLLASRARSSREKQRNIADEEKNRRNLAAKAQSLRDLLGNLSASAPQGGNALAPAVKFSAMRGRLTAPVEGKALIRFGQMTDGRPALGESFAAPAGAAVLAPAEGAVRYAGAFRSYGQVLIIDAGENYYIILAGLAKIYAAPGSFVLQGEPVGAMETALPANKEGYRLGKAAPRLYIEIRKDGKPVDPALWWASGRAGAAPS